MCNWTKKSNQTNQIVDVSTVRWWLIYFGCGDNDISDKSCSVYLLTNEIKSALNSSSVWIELMNDGLHRQHFPDNDTIIAVGKQVTSVGGNFYEHDIQAIFHRWQKCKANCCDYVDNWCFISENMLYSTVIWSLVFIIVLIVNKMSFVSFLPGRFFKAEKYMLYITFVILPWGSKLWNFKLWVFILFYIFTSYIFFLQLKCCDITLGKGKFCIQTSCTPIKIYLLSHPIYNRCGVR